MSESEKPLFDSSKMLYRYSLNPGLQASVLNFPFMLHENIENMKEILKICFQNYINFFEAVEFYDLLSSEKTFVQTLKELNAPSEKIVVLLKIYKKKYLYELILNLCILKHYYISV